MEKKYSQRSFQKPLLKVLGRKTNHTANTPVHHREMYAEVCAEAGVDEHDFGFAKGTKTLQSHRWIGFAFREMRNHHLTTQVKKGQWALTDAGVAEAANLNGESQVLTDLADTVLARMDAQSEAPPEAPSAPEEVPMAKVVRLPVKQNPYSDKHLRSLAIAATACFGKHSARSEICRDCHLQSDCITQLRSYKSEVAAKLREEQASQNGIKKGTKKNSDLSIEDLLSEEISPPKKGNAKLAIDWSEENIPADLAKKLQDEGWAMLKSKDVSTCSHCNGSIERGEKVLWRAGSKNPGGTHHIKCVMEIYANK